MRRIILILFLIKCFVLFSQSVYYVATDGDDEAIGDIDHPWATFDYSFDQVSAGDTVYYRGGTYNTMAVQYKSGLNGSYNSPIVFTNYLNETPIIDGSTATERTAGITFNASSYIKLIGITIRNIKQHDSGDAYSNGFSFTYCDNITLDQCVAHDIGYRAFYFFNCDTAYITNCDAYNVVDSLSTTPGNAGDGFMAILSSYGSTYMIFRGCRAWHVSDDGWDVENNGYIEIDSCWAIMAGGYEDYNYGRGFKLNLSISEDKDTILRRVTNCMAVYCRGQGIATNDGNIAIPMIIYNNVSAYNGKFGQNGYGFAIANTTSSNDEEYERVLRNNIAYQNTTSAIFVAGGALYTHSNNSWDSYVIVNDSDFVSIDSTGITGARQPNGALPNIDFLKITSTSDLIDKGTDTIIASIIIDSADFSGAEPDLGWYEYYQTPTPPAYVPQLSTNYPTRIRYNSVYTGGNVINNGGASITAKGICYSTLPDPTTSDSTVACGSGDDDYTTVVPDLTANTAYYFRAYATNSEGTGYGASEQVTTSAFSYGKSPSGKLYRINGKYIIFR